MGPISYSFEELVAHKESGKVPAAAIENLRSQVDEILTKPTFKVTEIDIPRPSGDMHDYMSVSPYRWPNPDTPDGLPWVRRDGHHNPNTARNPRGAAPYGRVHRLALAAFYFPEKATEYAEYANRQLYDWFLNPESYMKPNAKYAQSIPGVCDGCSPGIIDFANAHLLFDGMGILEAMGLLDMDIKEGVKQWFVEFTNWLMTDDNIGIQEGSAADNHGAWYDEQILSAAIFCEREPLVRRVLRSSYVLRTKGKIKPDGSQPHELLRATPLGYSFYALDALIIVANLAERRGYSEYWGIDEDRGECILKRAVDFTYPYVLDPESCPYPDLHHGSYGPRILKMLASVNKRHPYDNYEELIAPFVRDEKFDELWRLEPVL